MDNIRSKPHLLILSHVLPFPGKSGQQQRVFYTLKALRRDFFITFLTVASSFNASSLKERLLDLCDDVIILPSVYSKTSFNKLLYKIAGNLYVLKNGLKFSNFIISKVEFTPQRIRSAAERRIIDCVLFEYWHAAECASIFRENGILTILDMHNILWRSYERYLQERKWVPRFLGYRLLKKYKKSEEQAWRNFNLLVAINAAEKAYVEQRINNTNVTYIPMGIDLSLWPYSWNPIDPPRVAFYGGLGHPSRQKEALRCYNSIMPKVWESFPETELWLVGSDPPAFIRNLAKDKRVKVTGYIKNVQDCLKTMTLVLCPFSGTFGFRSRLIEIMALGIPVVATEDSAYGMELKNGSGIFLSNNNEELSRDCLALLGDSGFSKKHSTSARMQIEDKFSFEATYGRLPRAILNMLDRYETASSVAQRMLVR